MDLHAPAPSAARAASLAPAPAQGLPKASPGALAQLIRPLLPLYLVIHIGFVGYGMMVVLFTHMLVGGNSALLPADATTGHRTAVLGVLLALYPVGQFFGTPFLSSLSDRIGRRPVLLRSLAVTSVCYLFIALALYLNSLPLLGLALTLCGLAEANVAIAQSAIADVSPADERGRLFGYIYIAVRLGYVTGPLIGGHILAWTHSPAVPFLAVWALLIVALAWTYFGFGETHKPVAGALSQSWIGGLRHLLSTRDIRMLYLLNFALYVAIFGYSRTVVIYLTEQWKMGVNEITFFYAGFAAAVLLANLVMMPYLSKALGLARLAALTALAGGATTVAVALAASKPMLWTMVLTSSCLLSLCLSSCAALLSDSTPAAEQGEAMGGNEALQVAGQAIGAAAGGFLAALSVSLPILASGGLVIAAALLLVMLRRAGPRQASASAAS